MRRHTMRRYKGLELRVDYGDCCDDPSDDPSDGLYYLMLVSPQRGGEHYRLLNDPPRTNGSREICTNGWLGETDNVNRYADGAVRVQRDSAGRVRVSAVDVALLAAAEETSADGE